MSDQPKEPDRRSAARVPLEVWVEEQQPDAVYFQLAANLSAGGLYLERTVPHPVGTRVSLSFKLPGDADAIRAAAEIVKIDQAEAFGMHLKFLDLPADAAERIARYVERQRLDG